VGWAKRARAIGGTIAAASSLLPACDGNYDLPADRRWESTHFTYATRASDSSVCPDLLGPLEEHFALLQSYLGFDWAAGAKITYEKMLDGADFAAHGGCGSDAAACTMQSMVVSPAGFDLHELVHAYLWPTGDPPPVLMEGVAVVLACQTSLFAQPKPAQSWDQLASLGYDPGHEVYDAGAWLVGYLLTQYDPKLFTTVYQRLPPGPDAGTMDAAFRDVYGQSLATIWAAALAGTAPRDGCIWQCSRPPVPVDGTPVATDGVCGTIDLFHPFTLASTTLVGLTSTAAGLQLQSCDEPPLPTDSSPPGVLHLYELPSGSYFVESTREAGTMMVQALPSSVLAPTCAQATDLAPFAGRNGFRVTGPDTGGPQWFLPLPPPPAGTSHLTTFGGGAAMMICASCDPASCVNQLQLADWSWAPGQMVSIEVNPFPPDSYFGVLLSWF
jgi:hypothetical protein